MAFPIMRLSARDGSVPTVSTFVLVAKDCSNHTVHRLAPSAAVSFWRGYVVPLATSPSSVGRSASTLDAEGSSPSFADATYEHHYALGFPPTAHPGRELFTFSLFALLIFTAVVWGGSKLIWLIPALTK